MNFKKKIYSVALISVLFMLIGSVSAVTMADEFQAEQSTTQNVFLNTQDMIVDPPTTDLSPASPPESTTDGGDSECVQDAIGQGMSRSAAEAQCPMDVEPQDPGDQDNGDDNNNNNNNNNNNDGDYDPPWPPPPPPPPTCQINPGKPKCWELSVEQEGEYVVVKLEDESSGGWGPPGNPVWDVLDRGRSRNVESFSGKAVKKLRLGPGDYRVEVSGN